MGTLTDRSDCGFNTLAQRMLKSSAWPKELEMGTRSLGNQLRKLDDGDTSYWSRAGRILRPALADALGLSEAEVDELLAAGAADDRAVPFTTFPSLRAFDPDVDAPPPGLPPELIDPSARWYRDGARRLWWVASEPDLGITRAWAIRRLGFRHVRARRWEDAVTQLPAFGRSWVDVMEAGGRDPNDTVLPESLRVVVAAPFSMRGAKRTDVDRWYHRSWRGLKDRGDDPDAPPTRLPAFERSDGPLPPHERRVDGLRSDLTTWKEIEAPDPVLWLPELVDWVLARLGRAARVDHAAALAFLEQDWLAPGLRRPGEAIEVLGLFHAGAGRDAAALVRQWLKERLHAAESDDTAAGWLLRHGPDLLVRATRARLERGWPAVLEPSRWLALLAEGEVVPDGRAALSLLEQNRVAEAKRVLARPGEVLALDALRRAGVLVPRGAEELGMATRWAELLLVEQAVEASLKGPPSSWGALLLGDEVSLRVLRALHSRACGGDVAFARAAIAAADVQRVETVAALEGAIIAVGLASALNPVPAEIASALLDAAKPFQSRLVGRTLPLVHADHRVAELSTHAGRVAEALLGVVAGRQVGPGRASSVLTQRDWFPAKEVDPAAVDLDHATWVLGARIEPSWSLEPLPPVCTPARWLRWLLAGDQPGEMTFPLKALRVAADEQGVAWSAALATAWRHWANESSSPPFAWIANRNDEALELWHHLPAELVDADLAAQMRPILAKVSPVLSQGVWSSWERAWRTAPFWIPPVAWTAMPASLLREIFPRLDVSLAMQAPNGEPFDVAKSIADCHPDVAVALVEDRLACPWAWNLEGASWLVHALPWRLLEPRLDDWLTRASQSARVVLGQRIQHAVEVRALDPREAWPLLRRAFDL